MRIRPRTPNESKVGFTALPDNTYRNTRNQLDRSLSSFFITLQSPTNGSPICSHPVKKFSCIHIVPFLFLQFLFLLSAPRLSPISEMVLILSGIFAFFCAFIKAYIRCRIILSTCEPGMTPDFPVLKENHEGLHKSRPGWIMIDRNQNKIVITTGFGIPGRSS